MNPRERVEEVLRANKEDIIFNALKQQKFKLYRLPSTEVPEITRIVKITEHKDINWNNIQVRNHTRGHKYCASCGVDVPKNVLYVMIPFTEVLPPIQYCHTCTEAVLKIKLPNGANLLDQFERYEQLKKKVRYKLRPYLKDNHFDKKEIEALVKEHFDFSGKPSKVLELRKEASCDRCGGVLQKGSLAVTIERTERVFRHKRRTIVNDKKYMCTTCFESMLDKREEHLNNLLQPY